MLEKIAIIGGGAWGSAIATMVAATHPERPVSLWMRDEQLVEHINSTHYNTPYLGEIALAKNLIATYQADQLADADLIFVIVPVQHIKAVMAQFAPILRPDVTLICGSKGIMRDSLDLPHQILHKLMPNAQIFTLSGPSFAKEVASGLPTALVLAGNEQQRTHRQQLIKHLASDRLRLYESDDLYGVELCAALKNVYAIAAGLCIGAGFGENARAALLARCLHEQAQLVKKCGGLAETIYGLAGLGDLMLTANSLTSRNTRYGYELAQSQHKPKGEQPLQEGRWTAAVAAKLARKHGVDTPIVDAVTQIIEEGADLKTIAKALMTRPLKSDL